MAINHYESLDSMSEEDLAQVDSQLDERLERLGTRAFSEGLRMEKGKAGILAARLMQRNQATRAEASTIRLEEV